MKKKLLLLTALLYGASLIAQSDDAFSVFKAALNNAIKHPTNPVAQSIAEEVFIRAICHNYNKLETIGMYAVAKKHESSPLVQTIFDNAHRTCPKNFNQIKVKYETQKERFIGL